MGACAYQWMGQDFQVVLRVTNFKRQSHRTPLGTLVTLGTLGWVEMAIARPLDSEPVRSAPGGRH